MEMYMRKIKDAILQSFMSLPVDHILHQDLENFSRLLLDLMILDIKINKSKECIKQKIDDLDLYPYVMHTKLKADIFSLPTSFLLEIIEYTNIQDSLKKEVNLNHISQKIIYKNVYNCRKVSNDSLPRRRKKEILGAVDYYSEYFCIKDNRIVSKLESADIDYFYLYPAFSIIKNTDYKMFEEHLEVILELFHKQQVFVKNCHEYFNCELFSEKRIAFERLAFLSKIQEYWYMKNKNQPVFLSLVSLIYAPLPAGMTAYKNDQYLYTYKNLEKYVRNHFYCHHHAAYSSMMLVYLFYLYDIDDVFIDRMNCIYNELMFAVAMDVGCQYEKTYDYLKKYYLELVIDSTKRMQYVSKDELMHRLYLMYHATQLNLDVYSISGLMNEIESK